jgi:lipopolysaccharide transport system permease protein
MFMGFYLFFLISGDTDMHASFFLLLVPLLIFQLLLLAMGIGIIISSLTTKYRDLAMLVGFGLQLWQYGAPIAYGLSLVPHKYQAIYMLNPVTPIITTFRFAFFGTGYFSIFYYMMSWFVTICVILLGLILFNRIEKTFMDTV